jgi:hypothetical protein
MQKRELFMPKMKITNGFPNTNEMGTLLTGDLLSGVIKVGDKLIISEEVKIPITAFQVLPAELCPTRKLISIGIPAKYENAVAWSSLYGNEFEIETVEP